MSKLLKSIAARHRPAYAAKMTAENGYDETLHTHPADLGKAGILTTPEADELQNCLDDLSDDGDPAAAFLNSASSIPSKGKLNDEDFVNGLMMAIDADEDVNQNAN